MVGLALALAACSTEGNGPETATPNTDPSAEHGAAVTPVAGASRPAGAPSSAAFLPAATFETSAGGRPVMTMEVADTPELQTCGLMHRREMPADQGMLFVFSADSSGPFWNRNTFIPLTLAWIAAGGTIVELTDMAPVRPEDNPQVNTFYGPRAMYRYVIEANQGWFARNGVATGDRVNLGDALAGGSGGAIPICREKGT